MDTNHLARLNKVDNIEAALRTLLDALSHYNDYTSMRRASMRRAVQRATALLDGIEEPTTEGKNDV